LEVSTFSGGQYRRRKRTILAGAFEAVMGAVYLDGGFEAAKKILLGLLEQSFRFKEGEPALVDNYKSGLQELFQKNSLPPPVYRTLTAKGPDHKKDFVVEVIMGTVSLAKARGTSIKSAEQNAAQRAMKKFLGKKIKELNSETFIWKVNRDTAG
jgi:ribonuclease-3